MALVGNYSVIKKSPGRFMSGTSISADRSNFGSSGELKNRHCGEAGMAKFSSIPNGYVHPYAWSIARTSGGLAAYRLSAAISETSPSLALGIGVSASLTASISTTSAVLALIVSLNAAITAGISVTNAQLAIILGLDASLSASGTITDAQLGNILGLIASLSASMSSTANVVNLINLSADIGGAEALSAQGLATALLDSNDIETNFSMRESLRLMLSALAGKVSGAPGTTITIRDINDTIDRIVATVDADGNRTAVTKDVS